MKFNFISYLKDRLISILLFFFLFLSVFFTLSAFHVGEELLLSIMVLFFLFGSVLLSYDYIRRRTFWKHFLFCLERLDEKYLISEIVSKPEFLEGELFFDALYEINKSMNEKIHDYRKNVTDFKEYIELWIHEVKIPIASSKLIAYNNRSKEIKKIDEQISRIENEVEQVLYYVRSENAEKDYLIKEVSLRSVINQVVVKNKEALLAKKITIKMENVDHTVLTDGKWFEYILNQIVNNSMKYAKEKDSFLHFSYHETKEEAILEIEDNGIGIAKTDLPRVFEKSFTGKNGRKGKNSTGMGLYIVKNLCDKLGHSIELKSEEGKGVKVILSFSKEGYYDVAKSLTKL